MIRSEPLGTDSGAQRAPVSGAPSESELDDQGQPMTSDDDWIFDPMLSALDRSLRREMRDEAEEVESIVAESELRARTFADVAREARNRGDLVAVVTTRRTFNGQILYAVNDLITIKSETYDADVNVADIVYMRAIHKGERGGKPSDDGPGTFEMRLMERCSPVDLIELGYRSIDETLIGRMITVGQDHVVVVDDRNDERTIPIAAIAYVVRRGRKPLR